MATRLSGMGTYQYVDQGIASLNFSGDNGNKLTVNGLNGRITDASKVARAVAMFVTLGDYSNYYVDDMLETVKKGFTKTT